MSKFIKREGKNSWLSDGTVYILSYFKDTNKVHYIGTHKGEITGIRLNVEYFNNINQLMDRVEELDLFLTIEQAEEILKRSNRKNVVFTEQQLKRIKDYVEYKNKIED